MSVLQLTLEQRCRCQPAVWVWLYWTQRKGSLLRFYRCEVFGSTTPFSVLNPIPLFFTDVTFSKSPLSSHLFVNYFGASLVRLTKGSRLKWDGNPRYFRLLGLPITGGAEGHAKWLFATTLGCSLGLSSIQCTLFSKIQSQQIDNIRMEIYFVFILHSFYSFVDTSRIWWFLYLYPLSTLMIWGQIFIRKCFH